MLRKLITFRGPYKILNLAWMAFFLTFVVWFSYAPFATTIAKDLSLSSGQAKTITLCNLALTIPARIIIGMVLDRFGPRITYSGLLIFSAFPTLAFAMAQDFNQLVISRLLLGIVGAGFVIGIRLVTEWFPAQQIGTAQGIYGGWGNFGSFGAKAGLPILAASTAFLNAGQANWRLAIGSTGVIAAIFGVIFYFNVDNTPIGKVYERPAKSGGMEVTSRRSFWALLLVNLPIFLAMGLIAWRLSEVKFITPDTMMGLWGLFVVIYGVQSYQSWKVNIDVVAAKKHYPPSDRYAIFQVFLLGLAYISSFGSELAVVSMLPEFFQKTFNLDYTLAGLSASCYPMINLIARPAGGVICDKVGSRKWALTLLLAGVGLSYFVVSQINVSWPLWVAIGTLMFSALFVCAGAGATFGIAPLLQRRVTGQIAGMIGAYGSVGSVFYAVLYSALPSTPFGNMQFFQYLGITSMVTAFLCAFCLKEPIIKTSVVGEEDVVLAH